jgi:hypothetical protein
MPFISRSFERIDYSIRSNKSVQRKLIVEFFERMRSRFDLDDYSYVGMGSMWYADFILFHKRLDLQNMTSIQIADGYSRAKFNTPFNCIEVRKGKTTGVLPKLPLARRALVWLDYDHELRDYIFRDLEIVLQEVDSGSIVIATVDAEVDKFGGPIEDEAVRMERLESAVGQYFPLGASAKDLEVKRFPKLVSRILIDCMSEVTARRHLSLRFVTTFNYHYKDGARMVTVGGMVANPQDRVALRELELIGNGYYGSNQIRIAVPPLTPREKVKLDSLLPRQGEIDRSDLGFDLSQQQIKAYRKFYRQYPVFWELSP